MSDELQPGDLVGDYALEQRLGGGGFGSVWRAKQNQTGQTVAVKVLRTDVYSADTVRLRSEVELLAATASSRSVHVVRVLGGGVEPTPYVVMEFIDGTDLGRELERRRRIPQLETIRIGKAVADALSALESVGIIHRDIKPANVMIDVDGVVKLTDFGIAKIVGFDSITATSQMPMSMAYAAPEAWEGQASHQSDLYSLGCLLFQCLAGRPPFTGSPAQLFREHTTKDPDWTLLPEGTVQSLRDLLRACLAKDPGERPRDSASVAERLAEAERELDARVAGSTATDLPVHEPQAFGPWLRREPHLTQPWAFLCIHETTGEKATVEIHFADDIEYGARLRKAVEVNSKLVPLGAERLLGTNRLVLRPGEAWTEVAPGQFAFWVAREELPVRPGPEVVDDATLAKASAALTALTTVAKAEGVELALQPESLRLHADGTVLLRRPGLATTGDDGMAWLRRLRLDDGTRTSAVIARDVAELAAGYTGRAGVASTPDTGFSRPGRDGTSVSEIASLRIPPAELPPAAPVAAPTRPTAARAEPEPRRATVAPPPPVPPPPRWRRVALFGGGGLAALALAAAGTAFALWPGDDESRATPQPTEAHPATATSTRTQPATLPPPTATATAGRATATPVPPPTATATPVPATPDIQTGVVGLWVTEVVPNNPVSIFITARQSGVPNVEVFGCNSSQCPWHAGVSTAGWDVVWLTATKLRVTWTISWVQDGNAGGGTTVLDLSVSGARMTVLEVRDWWGQAVVNNNGQAHESRSYMMVKQ